MTHGACHFGTPSPAHTLPSTMPPSPCLLPGESANPDPKPRSLRQETKTVHRGDKDRHMATANSVSVSRPESVCPKWKCPRDRRRLCSSCKWNSNLPYGRNVTAAHCGSLIRSGACTSLLGLQVPKETPLIWQVRHRRHLEALRQPLGHTAEQFSFED